MRNVVSNVTCKHCVKTFCYHTVSGLVCMQGSSHTDRVGGSARFVSIVGLGKKNEATAEPEWGPSVFQVCICCSHAPTTAAVHRHGNPCYHAAS